jgi:hypothetical protein
MPTTMACDFFTVPTVTFRKLFVFVVMHHESRRILHVNVTAHPTAEWTAQQLVEALGDKASPEATHLIRSRDRNYGRVFRRKAAALDLQDVVTRICCACCGSTWTTTTPGDATSRSMGTRRCHHDDNASVEGSCSRARFWAACTTSIRAPPEGLPCQGSPVDDSMR